MTLHRNIRANKECIIIITRLLHSRGSNAIQPLKMHSKVISANHWKLIGQIKDYFTKVTNDNSLKDRFNKHVVEVLQKLQPSVYENTLKFVDVAKDEKTLYNLPQVLTGLKLKIVREGENKEIVPKWKVAPPVPSNSNILSRTREIISLLATASGDESQLRRVEDLIVHIRKYPKAKSVAVKGGALRLLLFIRDRTKHPALIGAIGEAFALLGYCNPVSGRGIRILSIDGGGIRGLLVLEMLKKLEELTGKRIHDSFDFICGVSTGAIIACALAVTKKDLNTIATNYRNLSTKVFSQSAIWGTSNLVWTHSYYDTNLWEQMLRDGFGEFDMINTARDPTTPKLAVVSAIVNQSRVSAHIFRNYSLPWRVQSQYMGSHDHKVWEAVRASAAAPTYFEECKLGNLLHQDGGILVNNPTALAIHEAKQLWPNTPIQCVISFGTGRTAPSHPDNVEESSTNSSWKNKFLKILDSATDTEGVHTTLSDLLPDNVYYRFNPYLTEMLSMVEIDPQKLEQLERDALMYLRRNDDKFQKAAQILCETKSSTQKAFDWVNKKKEMVGMSLNN